MDGHETVTAQDGAEAVIMFRQHAKDVRAVILDLTMPNMDGLEAFSELRRIRANVPVQRGQGGSPVMNLRGEAVGVLISTVEENSGIFALRPAVGDAVAGG